MAGYRGATDLDVHDTGSLLLRFACIAALSTGLATWQPTGDAMYRKMGSHMAERGYTHTET